MLIIHSFNSVINSLIVCVCVCVCWKSKLCIPFPNLYVEYFDTCPLTFFSSGWSVNGSVFLICFYWGENWQKLLFYCCVGCCCNYAVLWGIGCFYYYYCYYLCYCFYVCYALLQGKQLWYIISISIDDDASTDVSLLLLLLLLLLRLSIYFPWYLDWHVIAKWSEVNA